MEVCSTVLVVLRSTVRKREVPAVSRAEIVSQLRKHCSHLGLQTSGGQGRGRGEEGASVGSMYVSLQVSMGSTLNLFTGIGGTHSTQNSMQNPPLLPLFEWLHLPHPAGPEGQLALDVEPA